MSKESMLQKDFKERDVQRMRNLITKKFNDSTGTQVGYKKKQEDYKEGDEWMENGKTWTIKNGIKMTISKLDLVKKTLQIPLTCPCCHKSMKKIILDKKMYFIHKKCFDCVIEYETKLRQSGNYQEYASNIMSKNIDAYIEDMNEIFNEILNTPVEDVVTEDGDQERWVGGKVDMEKMKNEFKEYIENVKKLKEQL